MKYHPDRNRGGRAEGRDRSSRSAPRRTKSSRDDAEAPALRPVRPRRRGRAARLFPHGRRRHLLDVRRHLRRLRRRSAAGAGGGGRAAARAQRGFDLETQVELTLNEIATGAEKTIEFERQDSCETCKGTGAKPGTTPVVCVQCGGQGRVAQQGFGGMFRMVTTCPNCRGEGTSFSEHCPTCGGTGQQAKKRVVTVKIPAGVHEGQAVRIAGEGEPGEAGGAGGRSALLHRRQAAPDLQPAQQRHRLPGADQLHAGRPRREDRRADAEGQGRARIPAGTQHGEVFKLKGKGLPDVRSGRRATSSCRF